MTTRALVMMCGLLLLPSSALAQTGALTALTVQFSQNGAILPAQVMTISLPSGASCGQVKAPPPPPITYITSTAQMRWDDPANPALDCIAAQGPGGVLLSLPLGANYTATAFFTDDRGTVSAVSSPSNSFTRGAPPPPPVPSGLRVRP